MTKMVQILATIFTDIFLAKFCSCMTDFDSDRNTLIHCESLVGTNKVRRAP
jgi:hypothetical protein